MRPNTIKQLGVGFVLILTLLVLADFVVHGHPYFGIDGAFGFHSWLGLGTWAAMVIVAEVLGFPVVTIAWVLSMLDGSSAPMLFLGYDLGWVRREDVL